MSAKLWKGEPVTLKFEYDFEELGGAQGTFALGDLPDGFLVSEVFANVETALVGGQTDIGEDGGGDADGYVAVLAQAAGATKAGGALVTDGVHKVDAAKDGVLMTISTSDLTAGKFQLYFRGFQV